MFDFEDEKRNNKWLQFMDWSNCSNREISEIESFIKAAYQLGVKHGFNTALCRVFEKVKEDLDELDVDKEGNYE